MPQLHRTTASPEATGALAAGVAALVRGGDTVYLIGELGSGKTTFTRAFAHALGADLRGVSSPTYVMVNQYPLPRTQAIRSLTHVDAYRIQSIEELDALGWDQLFDEHSKRAAPGTVALIEWPQRISAALAPDADSIVVELHHAGRSERAIGLTIPDSAAARPEAALLAEHEPVRCPTTGAWVAPTCPTYPFADERAKRADLGKWFNGSFRLSRPAENDDFTSGA